jgi:hypothetical protein
MEAIPHATVGETLRARKNVGRSPVGELHPVFDGNARDIKTGEVW